MIKKRNRDDVSGPANAPDYTLDFLEHHPGTKPSPGKSNPRKGWTRKKLVLFSIACVLAMALAGTGIWYWTLRSNPMGGFDTALGQLPSAPVMVQTEAPGASSQPGATATPSPLDLLMAQADTSFLKDTINILLIGVDHSVDRDTEEWVKQGGKQAFHSDVMLVLAVNKNTGTVNMISLPRDTYAQIPGVEGIYKLNASIDCGGGWPTEAGFEKVCEAASWMLGGIPVQYYYAVDMNAVKGLADAIGGVQGFDVEMDFSMAGRKYKAGVQDMNGQAVLDYLRVRKYIDDSGDLNRVNRQKKMLIAIFDKIKSNGLLTSIPGLIDAFDGNLYTNVPFSYTAGLALFAMDVEPDNIGMHSMGGRYYNGIFNWNFVITDQKARVELINQIYGVDVPEYSDYAAPAATRLWERMRAPVIKSQGLKALAKVKAKLDADAKLEIYTPPTPTPPPATPTPAPPAGTPAPPDETPAATPEITGEASGSHAIMLLSAGSANTMDITLNTTTIPAGYRQYLPDGPVWALYNKAVKECESLSASGSTSSMKTDNDQAVADVTSICSAFGISVTKHYWRVPYERNSNQIYVDFD